MEVPLGGLLRVYLRSTSVREGLSQRQVETNLEPWGVTYKIFLLLLFIIIIYLSCAKKKKRKRIKTNRRAESGQVDQSHRGIFRGFGWVLGLGPLSHQPHRDWNGTGLGV